MRHLAAADADWAALIQRVGRCGLKLKPEREPYHALIRAIAYQQLHGRAAEAILARFLALYPDTDFPAPQQVLATEQILMRGCGLSASKVVAIQGIAAATVDGIVPPLALAATLTDEELIVRLITLRGVGRWTVEMLLLFTLGRPDVLPVDDFAVREGWRFMKGFPVQPKPKALAEIGLAWSPYRSTAAWYLWRASELAKLSPTLTKPP